MLKKSPVISLGCWLLLVGCQASSPEQQTSPTADSLATPEITEAAPTPTTVSPTQEVPSQPSEVPPVTVLPTPTYPDEAYVSGGHSRHVVDVYLPIEGDGPFPTIITFHGGGFGARSKSLYAPVATHFTDQGYALVASNYRYALQDTPYPAQVEDAFCALGWVHSNAADFGFDPDRVYVMGDSAGGYLAAMLGTVDTPALYSANCPDKAPEGNAVKGVVALYGFFDLTDLAGHSQADIEGGLEALMGAPHSEVPPERLVEMSPMSWIDGSEPPFLIIHGTKDISIASWLSEEFAAALDQSGVDVSLLLLEAGHGFVVVPDRRPVQLEALGAIDTFLASLSGH